MMNTWTAPAAENEHSATQSADSMKRERMLRREKQYAVDVIERCQHGRYGKEFYFGMYLPGFSKQDAEEVGIETLAAMTFEDINERCIKNDMKPWQIWDEKEHGTQTPIGFDLAEKYFVCKAHIE